MSDIAPCEDSSRCRFRHRFPDGPWDCAHNHPGIAADTGVDPRPLGARRVIEWELPPEDAVRLLEELSKTRAGEATVEIPGPPASGDRYITPGAAARILEVSERQLAGMRRARRIASIGMTASEYRRARERAGWAPDDRGWAPAMFYRLADVERCSRERGRRAA